MLVPIQCKKDVLNIYKVVKTQTARFQKSAIPYMLKMLNSCQVRRKRVTFKKFDYMPVNHVFLSLYHCDNNKQ